MVAPAPGILLEAIAKYLRHSERDAEKAGRDLWQATLLLPGTLQAPPDLIVGDLYRALHALSELAHRDLGALPALARDLHMLMASVAEGLHAAIAKAPPTARPYWVEKD